MCSFATAGRKVIAFEPNQYFFNHTNTPLKKYIKRGGKNITLENYAVSEKSKLNIPFYTSSQSKGISSITKWHETHNQADFMVNTIRLDEYMTLKNISSINFLKIDTEGQDFFVLKSYNWIYIPEIILCEYEDKKTKLPLGYTWKDMCDFLYEKKYNIIISEWYPLQKYGSGGNHTFRCFHKYPCELKDKNSWGNFICFKEKKLYDQFCLLHEDKFERVQYSSLGSFGSGWWSKTKTRK